MWTLPAAAASFVVGIMTLGELAVPWPELLLASGLAGASFAAWSAPRRAPSRLAVEAGLAPPSDDPRSRILAAAGFWPSSREDPTRRRRWAPALLAATVLLGGGWAGVRGRSPADLGALEGRSVRFRGTAAADPRVFDHGWGLEARIHAFSARGGRATRSLRVWLSGAGPPPAVEAGRPIRGAAILRAVEAGEEGFHGFLASRGVAATARVSGFEVLGPSENPFLRMANAVRRALARGARAALPEREAGLLLGLTIGDTSRMDPEIEEDFRATGLGHLVAVSGSNVAMVLVPVLSLAALAGAGLRARLSLGLAALALFALITRWEPSVLRASVMAALAMAGVMAGRPRDTANLLAGAVLVLLVADPRLVWSLAFRLSVAATAGIVALAGPLAERMRRLPRSVALAVAATVAAQAGVAPLLLASFGVVPGAALPANVLAFPAVGVGFVAGSAASGLALLWEPAGRALGHLAAVPLAYLAEVADGMARIPLPSLTATGGLVPVLAAVGVAGAVWVLRGRRRRGRAAVVATACLVLWSVLSGAGPPEGLTVTFLDVGQGDAAVVQSPGGATILVDAGPDGDLVARKLAALGVRRIDVAVASHAHADHVEGFAAVLSRHAVGLLLEPGCPADSPAHRRFLAASAAEGVRVRHARGGEALRVGDVLVEVLGPDECSVTGPNDDSVVLRIGAGGSAVLFPGDAEVPAQEDLLEDGDPVRASVLKVPHHGAATSTDAFFRAVGARVAVVSVGENDYGHPRPETLAALEEAGARTLRTDLAGDIRIVLSDGAVRVESAAG